MQRSSAERSYSVCAAQQPISSFGTWWLQPSLLTKHSELVAIVKEHQQPTPSFIVQRYHFNTRVQCPGESISEFVAQLRKFFSKHCRYGDSLEDMLRDHLVCGCLDKRLQCKLLANPDLTFAKALATAKAMETAERSAKDLHSDSTGQVHLM